MPFTTHHHGAVPVGLSFQGQAQRANGGFPRMNEATATAMPNGRHGFSTNQGMGGALGASLGQSQGYSSNGYNVQAFSDERIDRAMNLPRPPMGYDCAHSPTEGLQASGMVPKRWKATGVLKLPATAVCNGTTGDWEETDPHRLAQRRKQLCFGKVTEGYLNFLRKVPKEERQDGNELHPITPRLNQVCSKRSWDCQVGKWRRSLHYWDMNPSPEEMRKSPEELQASRRAPQQQPRVIVHSAALTQQQAIKVKYSVKGDGHCMILMTPLQTSFTDFVARLEAKNGPLVSLYYRDEDNDVIDVDDDVSLRAFLDFVQTATPPPKLSVECYAPDNNAVSQALHVLATKLPAAEVTRLSEELRINLTCPTTATERTYDTPTKDVAPIPELMELVTPTPEGKTPAMNVYNGLWTPESECRERRKLFA
ncbi:Histone RNA hairpin-binding protein [Diplonema papillatum]|nr:Histone RNA hairpin-binding protein [Diplonema papillatum]